MLWSLNTVKFLNNNIEDIEDVEKFLHNNQDFIKKDNRFTKWQLGK